MLLGSSSQGDLLRHSCVTCPLSLVCVNVRKLESYHNTVAVQADSTCRVVQVHGYAYGIMLAGDRNEKVSTKVRWRTSDPRAILISRQTYQPCESYAYQTLEHTVTHVRMIDHVDTITTSLSALGVAIATYCIFPCYHFRISGAIGARCWPLLAPQTERLNKSTTHSR